MLSMLRCNAVSAVGEAIDLPNPELKEIQTCRSSTVSKRPHSRFGITSTELDVQRDLYSATLAYQAHNGIIDMARQQPYPSRV